MAGLDPAIQVLRCCTKVVDARHKAGHDDVERYCYVAGFFTGFLAILFFGGALGGSGGSGARLISFSRPSAK